MGMYNPPHPGEMLKEFMSDSITVTQLAADLNITRTALSKIINGRTAISTAMAEKLAIAFPFTTPKMWLIWQNDYDLWQIEHDPKKFAAITKNVTPDVLNRANPDDKSTDDELDDYI